MGKRKKIKLKNLPPDSDVSDFGVRRRFFVRDTGVSYLITNSAPFACSAVNIFRRTISSAGEINLVSIGDLAATAGSAAIAGAVNIIGVRSGANLDGRVIRRPQGEAEITRAAQLERKWRPRTVRDNDIAVDQAAYLGRSRDYGRRRPGGSGRGIRWDNLEYIWIRFSG